MRRQRSLRELRLVVPDARSPAVRERIAAEVAVLDKDSERDALMWIVAVPNSATSRGDVVVDQ
jgi:hypothetical protein